MNRDEFVSAIREEIVDSNLSSYRQLFIENRPESATDPYWQEALRFFGSLPTSERTVFFRILRQVTVDTISSILGMLDGVWELKDQEGDFDLLLAGERLNGDLQDEFLAAEEDSPSQ